MKLLLHSYNHLRDDMRHFSINLQGRIKNFNLPQNKPLIPLFEAIVNSIHAIEERKQNGEKFNGKIDIKIIRENQIAIEETKECPPIISFEIIDNGVGFNEPNFSSFMESDSEYKSLIGGKGVGRFSWLIAFEKAEIRSIYLENTGYVKREFEFSVNKSDINDTLVDNEKQEDNETTVKLIGCKNPFAKHLNKRGNTIAMRIIQHCLVYFISEDCPQINLIDGEEIFDLNKIFKEKIHTEDNKVTIKIGNYTFDLLHVKAEETTIGGNKLYLCANNRLVEVKELEKFITDLDGEIYKNNGFWYIGVLRGEYLDKKVDMNRLSFAIPENGISDDDDITMEKIMQVTTLEIEKFLSDYLLPISTQKIAKIKNYVTEKAPQFRHLLKYMSKEVFEIKPNLSDDKLDDELHRIKRDFDRKVSYENESLLNALNRGVISSEEYIKKFELQIDKINSNNSAALADYIAHRKVILDLLKFALQKKDDGKFQSESFLHNLIYPMRTTADEIPYSNHNLWLIDEKLSYCSYISSDVPFNNDRKKDRTDIMFLNSPVAISDEENQGREYDEIILFELKKPMRNDYNFNDNPITQLYNYVTSLKTNKVQDKDGRLIKIGVNTKFYLYAICDITSTLTNKIVPFFGLRQTPDKLGYYDFNDNLNAYIEILSYDKILNDAQKRNKILFDKLGL